MLIIDRFEGKYAIVEQELGKYLNIKRNQLPKNAKEGDCLFIDKGIYKIDEIETKKRKEDIIKLQNSMWE